MARMDPKNPELAQQTMAIETANEGSKFSPFYAMWVHKFIKGENHEFSWS
jgi:hypothetical protein